MSGVHTCTLEEKDGKPIFIIETSFIWSAEKILKKIAHNVNKKIEIFSWNTIISSIEQECINLIELEDGEFVPEFEMCGQSIKSSELLDHFSLGYIFKIDHIQ